MAGLPVEKGENAVSSSPSSDYDPLGDDSRKVEVLLSSDEENSQTSLSSSVDRDSLPSFEPSSFDRYAVTPPVNIREMKRQSEKKRHHVATVQTQKALNARRLHRRSSSGAFVENLDDVTCQIEATSPETAFTERTSSFSNRKKKDATKNRSFDRDLKRRASDAGTLSFDMSSKAINLNASLNLKIDSPNRFMSLQSKPVSVSEKKEPSLLANVFLKQEGQSHHFQRRSTSYSNLECPPERLEFHKTFSALINLHNNPEKKKKEADNSPIQYVRQLSSEQELFQIELSDLIWLELQAHLKGQSIEARDAYLLKTRGEVVPEVIAEILNFKVRLKNDRTDGQLSPVREDMDFTVPASGGSSATLTDSATCSNATLTSATPSGSHANVATIGLELYGEQLNTSVVQQKEALVQVTELLQKMEFAESLYPTCKALGDKYPEYSSEQFQNRLQTLLLWLNITKDIGNKLSLMANVLYVDNIQGIDWPWVDYESPFQLLKKIRDTPDTITPDIVLTKDKEPTREIAGPSALSPGNAPSVTSGFRKYGGVQTVNSGVGGMGDNGGSSSHGLGLSDGPTSSSGAHTNIGDGLSDDDHVGDGLSDDSHPGDGLSDKEIHSDGLSEQGQTDSPGDGNEGPGNQNDGLSDQDDGLSDHSDGLSDRSDGLSDHSDGLSDTNDGLSDQSDGLSNKNDGLSDQNDGLSDQSDGRSNMNDGLSDQNDGLSDRSDGLSNKNDGLSDTNDGLSDPETEFNSSSCDKCDTKTDVHIKNKSDDSGAGVGVLGAGSSSTTLVEEVARDFTADALSHSTPKAPTPRKLSGALKNARVRFTDVISPETSPGDSTADLIGLSPGEKTSPQRLYQSQRSISNVSTVSRSDSTFSFDENHRTSIYRYFVERHLKKMGLRKLMTRLKDLLQGTLQRAQQALEIPPEVADLDRKRDSLTEPVSPSDIHLLSSSPSMDGVPLHGGHEPPERRQSFKLYGSHSAHFCDMNLPSFLPTYLFLVRIPLDVVHECLRLRLEQRPDPDTEPSILSIRQLIRECKEVLMGAVMVKSYYQQMLATVLPYKVKDSLENDLQQYEEDLQQILEVYFDYMRIYMSQLQTIYEMSKRLKNFLEDEWNFTKQVCPHVRGGEANAGKRFCLMASSLLGSIGNFLESNMDACVTKLYDSMLLESLQDDALHEVRRYNSRSGEVRKGITHTCRTFKETFAEARERASKALGFAKLLRKDLEIAADFNIQGSPAELFGKLLDTGHIQVLAPHSPGYMMFVPQRIQGDRAYVIQLLNVSSGHDESQQHQATSQDGYLILVKCADCARNSPDKCLHWRGPKMRVDPTAETTIALSHIQVEGLFLVVIHSSQLSQLRSEFTKLMGAVVQLVNEQTSCHQVIAESLIELRTSAMELRANVVSAITQVVDGFSAHTLSDMEEHEKNNIQKLYRETLHQCYSFGFDYHKELVRLVSGELREELAKVIVQFAIQWMKFVADKCEKGKGVKPRWAKPGFDFLCVACEPRVTAFISETEFKGLKDWMNKCIVHVIGERVHPSVSSPGRCSSPLPERLHRNMSCPQGISRSTSRASSHSTSSGETLTPLPAFTESHPEFGRYTYERKASVPAYLGRSDSDVEILDGGDEGGIVLDIHHHKDAFSYSEQESCVVKNRRRHIQAMEQARTNKLYAAKQIGRITQKKQQVEVYIANKKVNFKWQRGIKIGEGQFGKVYTAVNTDSGELMAVKEIRFQPNDHQTIKDVAEEIKIFEDLDHPGLVKYYGVEVHRDEMLIFMEYCAEGTIEEVAKQGLGEEMIRKYTSEILMAVTYLHEHDIVHRDIKGANIFLTLDGPVKLGDFGCAVKLKNHSTMPGEVNTMVGTSAFMAPEVITRNEKEGTGRAADIWSVACVVIEMSTGKRPWHELKNNFNIMYKVGTGGTPTIPESLSHEGRQFLEACLVHDPDDRPTASDLLFHPFLKYELDDDRL